VIELALFLLLDPTSAHLADREAYHQPVERPVRLRCDDGSPVWTPDGGPNWDCELAGCSPHEQVCWSDRLDVCFDESGDSNGVCKFAEPQKCDSRWSCFKLWASCDTEYTCEKPVGWGCGGGTCASVQVVKPSLPWRPGTAQCMSPTPTLAPGQSLSPGHFRHSFSASSIEAALGGTPSRDLLGTKPADMVRGHGDV